MMPQLGETVTEGTITRWMKAVGDTVERDEPLFEVSTDKVDSEVPSPAAGVLTEILVPEGETVEVGVRLAVIGDGAGAAPPAAAPAAAAAGAGRRPGGRGTAHPPAAPPAAPAAPAPRTRGAGPAAAHRPLRRRHLGGRQRRGRSGALGALARGAQAAGRERHQRRPRSPAPARAAGSPAKTCSGRRVARSAAAGPAAAAAAPPPPPVAAPGSAAAPAAPAAERRRRRRPGRRWRRSVPPGTRWCRSRTCGGGRPSTWCARRRRRPTRSSPTRSTSRTSSGCARPGASGSRPKKGSRSPTSRSSPGPRWRRCATFPSSTPRWCDDSLLVHAEVNLGIAVDLSHEGLIVPVIHRAEEVTLRGVARRIRDLAERARGRQLNAGRHRRRDVLHHQRRPLRHVLHRADHQPAPGGDPRHRRHRAAGRWW